MKLNLEIELDWIDEEKGIDQTVKTEIINGIMRKLNSTIMSKMQEKIESKIDKSIVARIDKATDKLFKDFLKRPVQITDSYGSNIKQYNNVSEIIKEKFDNFMTQTVDRNGNASTSSYETKFKRLEFIIDKQLKDMANEFTTGAVKKVSEEIRSHVKDGLTTKLGAELMNVLKVDEMLKLEA